MQEACAILREARLSAQKARLVVDQVRGLKVEQALNILSFSPKKAAVLVKKVLLSAMANAEHNEGMDIDDLSVARIYVDEASKLKRFSPRAKGRANRIVKHSCHITVVVAPKVEAPKAKSAKPKKAKAATKEKQGRSKKDDQDNQGQKGKQSKRGK